MPIKGEVQRKIKQIKEGLGVKAPFAYWHQVLIPETKKEYPDLSKDRIAQIAGARWANISKEIKIKLIKRWQPRARTKVRRLIRRISRRR